MEFFGTISVEDAAHAVSEYRKQTLCLSEDSRALFVGDRDVCGRLCGEFGKEVHGCGDMTVWDSITEIRPEEVENYAAYMPRGLDMEDKQYDEGKAAKDAARKLIKMCVNVTEGYDGNYYEAVESSRECRCGRCLRKMTVGERYFNLYQVVEHGKSYNWLRDFERENDFAYPTFCRTCFEEIVPKDLQERWIADEDQSGEANTVRREWKYKERYR